MKKFTLTEKDYKRFQNDELAVKVFSEIKEILFDWENDKFQNELYVSDIVEEIEEKYQLPKYRAEDCRSILTEILTVLCSMNPYALTKDNIPAIYRYLYADNHNVQLERKNFYNYLDNIDRHQRLIDQAQQGKLYYINEDQEKVCEYFKDRKIIHKK